MNGAKVTLIEDGSASYGSIVVPSLKANTFGVGVRFRAHGEWLRVFESAGYDVKSSVVLSTWPFFAYALTSSAGARKP